MFRRHLLRYGRENVLLLGTSNLGLPDDISLTIRITSGRVQQSFPQFYYGFHIEEDKINDSTLSVLDKPANYKEVMANREAAKLKGAMKSEIQSMLVVKGYTQTYGIDYEETFSPVAKIKSTRIMFSIVVFHDYEIWKMDVKTAFLNKKLIEDVFMAQPEGFENARWYTSHRKRYPNVTKCKRLVGEMFRSDTYLDKILKRFKMENSKKGNLPIHHGIKISKDLCPKTNEELERMSRVQYALAIGSIMYAMTCTRPDVSFALSMVSRHQQNPGEGHWTAIKNILKWEFHGIKAMVILLNPSSYRLYPLTA
ncbi:retrotransposon protein, putative, ty1-copia subclass [Tanacetum coccineum]